MKKYAAPLLIVLLILNHLSAGVQIGDSLENTLEKLGKPIGSIELRDKTLLLYPQGEVELKNDSVTEIDLMTEKEFAAEQERLKKQREEWLAQKERLAEANRKKGEAIRTAQRTNLAFTTLPAEERIDFWRKFQVNYPRVDVSEEIAKALESYKAELDELQTQQRIAELEARVAKAEQEAAAAQLETERLRQEAAQTRQSTHYGLRHYYDPFVHSRYVYRPPTVTIFTNNNNQQVRPKTTNHWNYNKFNSNGTSERVATILSLRKNQ